MNKDLTNSAVVRSRNYKETVTCLKTLKLL